MADTRTVCKACLQPVDRIFDVPYQGAPESEWELAGWIHTRRPDTDHEPEPIPAEAAPFIDQVCDFCGEPNLSWIFPTDINQPREFHGLKFTEEAWAACDLCREAVLAATSGQDLVQRIRRRSLPLKSVSPGNRTAVMAMMADQYQQFLNARSGEPITLAEYIS